MSLSEKARLLLREWPGAPDAKEMPPELLPTAFEQYKLYLELTDSISERRQSANSFFVGLNTGMVALLGYVNVERAPVVAGRFYLLISAGGIVLCVLWALMIHSYRNLNAAKFEIIQEIENVLPLRPYSSEWEALGHGRVGRLYRPFTHIESGVPWVFVIVFEIVFLTNVSWLTVVEFFSF